MFFDYYAALAFDEGYVSMNNVQADIENYAHYADALALYAGLVRDNGAIAKGLIGILDREYKVRKDYELSDLEKRIESLFLPEEDASSVDKVATDDLNSQRDYEAMDDDFDERRASYSSDRSKPAPRVLRDSTPLGRLEFLTRLINALSTFYKVFRNLENLDGVSKANYLDRILDYHIYCNIQLIEYYHSVIAEPELKTLFTYLATLGGQDFLSSHAGNQTLGKTIDHVLAKTRNSFKKLLLVCFYGDLRLKDYDARMRRVLEETNSFAAIEIIYAKVRMWMVGDESKEIPAGLVALFKVVFEKRQEVVKKKKLGLGVATNFGEALRDIKKDHLLQKALRAE
ncbi:MAG TPA: hypothetical protein VHE55_01840 [Fimbriimonadaceae bacterium]|nr:hypothetical protein [Fimbriimonadaceae bacterium]